MSVDLALDRDPEIHAQRNTLLRQGSLRVPSWPWARASEATAGKFSWLAVL